MTICIQCRWGETEFHRRGDYALYCGCPAAEKPVLRVDYVSGKNVYSGTGDALESRPFCKDTNTDGACPWWEAGEQKPDWMPLHSDNPARDARPGIRTTPELPRRRSLLECLFGCRRSA